MFMHAIQTSLTAASSRMTANSSPLQEEEEQEQHDLEDEDVDMEEAERLADERMGFVENGGQQQHSRPADLAPELPWKTETAAADPPATLCTHVAQHM